MGTPLRLNISAKMWHRYPTKKPKMIEGTTGIVPTINISTVNNSGINKVCVIPRCVKCFDNHFAFCPSFDCSISISGSQLPK